MTASLELEQCIADALAAVPMISSSALAALYSEVEVAAAEADVAARPSVPGAAQSGPSAAQPLQKLNADHGLFAPYDTARTTRVVLI